MFRIAAVAVLLVAVIQTAQAHFVFVVPDPKDSAKAVVVLSEDLDPDENVSAEKLATLRLTCRDGAEKETPVIYKVGAHELSATVPGDGPRVVFGALTYDVMKRGDAKPFLLTYYPKAILGAVPADKAALGEKALPVEIVPVMFGRNMKFRFLAAGQPAADAEVTVIKPEGGAAKVKTDKDGLTPPFPAKGRYGAWAKDVVATPGEHGGKKYDEVRRYATLVIDLSEPRSEGSPSK